MLPTSSARLVALIKHLLSEKAIALVQEYKYATHFDAEVSGSVTHCFMASRCIIRADCTAEFTGSNFRPATVR